MFSAAGEASMSAEEETSTEGGCLGRRLQKQVGFRSEQEVFFASLSCAFFASPRRDRDRAVTLDAYVIGILASREIAQVR